MGRGQLSSFIQGQTLISAKALDHWTLRFLFWVGKSIHQFKPLEFFYCPK